MDTMTAKRCKIGEGRLDFARVLVEFDAMKGIRRRNEEFRERNNTGNYMGNRKFRDRKQYKEGRSYNSGTKIYESKGSKGDVWKKKVMNEGKHNKTKNTDLEKKGKNTYKREGLRNVNKFATFNEIGEEDDELEKLKGRMVVDVFLNKKIQPNFIKVKSWTQDMVKYFKEQWEIDRNKEVKEVKESIEDVLETSSRIAKELSIEEMEGMDTTILH
ncbi:hypothetical protein Tco_1257051 [Tanacetum coccineum]